MSSSDALFSICCQSSQHQGLYETSKAPIWSHLGPRYRTITLERRTGRVQCVDKYGGRLRKNTCVAPLGQLNHLYGAFLPVFLWLIILTGLVHSPYLAYLRIIPCVHMQFLAKLDPTAKACGHLCITLCAHMVEEVSWVQEWEICGLGREGPASSLSCSAILILEFQAFLVVQMV